MRPLTDYVSRSRAGLPKQPLKQNTFIHIISKPIMKNILILLTLLLLVACTTQQAQTTNDNLPVNPDSEVEDTSNPVEEEVESAPPTTEPQDIEELPINWKDIELIDVKTKETFKISDFDKPVILETFAVWCPTCKKQQDKIKDLHEEVGDDIISISLDIDPNENDQTVLNHVNKHGFTTWRFTVAPADMTKQLIEEFGRGIAAAPAVPKVLICPNGYQEFLPSGVKESSELIKFTEKCQ